MIRSPEQKEDPRSAAWISAALLRWFRTAARPMAWRETRDPYRIWVSEIMLQQTRVETVAPYYDRFLLEFPDMRSLARAELDAVLKAWEGLGYYSRARNLHRAAGILVARHGGEVPRTVEALTALPGIGRSTAGAIAAIAFGADVPILDANARRVVARLYAVEGDPRSGRVERVLWERSARLVRRGKGRDTALAVMDLGAVAGDEDPGGPMEVSRAGVVPEPLPRLQDVVDRRRGKGTHIGKFQEKAVVVGSDGFDPCLLEHDLRDPDPIRIPGLPPRHRTGLRPEPAQQRCGDPRAGSRIFLRFFGMDHTEPTARWGTPPLSTS